ncbi:hypothetical protein QBC39DRAFT_375542 [Podospora conica]|nr:hypothetical protein QBC39DRAFT_375542 [Schizothecium conicum]
MAHSGYRPVEAELPDSQRRVLHRWDQPVEQLQDKKHFKPIKRATLVVAPLTLIRQWEAEIKEKIDKEYVLEVYVQHRPQRSKVPMTTFNLAQGRLADVCVAVEMADPAQRHSAHLFAPGDSDGMLKGWMINVYGKRIISLGLLVAGEAGDYDFPERLLDNAVALVDVSVLIISH